MKKNKSTITSFVEEQGLEDPSLEIPISTSVPLPITSEEIEEKIVTERRDNKLVTNYDEEIAKIEFIKENVQTETNKQKLKIFSFISFKSIINRVKQYGTKKNS